MIYSAIRNLASIITNKHGRK